MSSAINYLKNSSLVTLALLVAFVGLGAVAAVLEAISWQTLGDWAVKAVLISAIFVAMSMVVGMLGGMSKTDK